MALKVTLKFIASAPPPEILLTIDAEDITYEADKIKSIDFGGYSLPRQLLQGAAPLFRGGELQSEAPLPS
ncbi:hypothetical protein C8J57DRAFT_1721012 [Mycena rebaudengoi]|nr:hypothetical protein C8J57DRAFT_1721012 [Mycena rebaudengoi]